MFRVSSHDSRFDMFDVGESCHVLVNRKDGNTRINVSRAKKLDLERVALFAPFDTISTTGPHLAALIPFAKPLFSLSLHRDDFPHIPSLIWPLLPRLTNLFLFTECTDALQLLRRIPTLPALESAVICGGDTVGVETCEALTDILASPVRRHVTLFSRAANPPIGPHEKAYHTMIDAMYNSVSRVSLSSYPRGFYFCFCSSLVAARIRILALLGGDNAIARKDGDHAIAWRVLGFLVDSEEERVMCARRHNKG